MKLLELYNRILLETKVYLTESVPIIYTPENVTSFPAKDIEGMEGINSLEQEMNNHFKIDGKFTEESAKMKLVWAKSVNLNEPIEVAIGTDGTPIISDGHHRTLAARILGKDVNSKIRSRLEPNVFNLYMVKIKQGLSVREINPDFVNLNKHPNILINR